MFNYKGNSRNSYSRVAMILSLLFIVLVMGYAVYELFLIPDPVVSSLDAFKLLPADKTITFNANNADSLDISISQGNKLINLLQDTPETSERIYRLQIKPKELKLNDGSAVIIINATAGVLKKTKYEFQTVIDTEPPALEIINTPDCVYRGSGGFALLSAKGADSVFIKQGNRDFRAFEYLPETDSHTKSFQETGNEPNMETKGYGAAKIYTVFFPAVYDIENNSLFYAVATDNAGNQRVKPLNTKLSANEYTSFSININDVFVKTVVSSLLNETSISDVEASFKKVNEDLRKESNEKLLDIAKKTRPQILWEGPFLQLSNSKVMAKYGDRRIYIYHDKEIGKSIHLGYDLASFAHAPVEAANSGIVLFAGDLGIFGDTIIIDHGLGLMSLYGHLSMLIANEGQTVKKGEIIAKTGSSGFAGGDHLHFGLLIHGYEVSPLYWWDRNWVKINVFDRLETY